MLARLTRFFTWDTSTANVNYIQFLPNPVLQYVFEFLDVTDLANVNFQSKVFHKTVNNLLILKRNQALRYLSTLNLTPINFATLDQVKECLQNIVYILALDTDTAKPLAKITQLTTLLLCLYESLYYLTQNCIIDYNIYKGLRDEGNDYNSAESFLKHFPNLSEKRVEEVITPINQNDIQRLKNNCSNLFLLAANPETIIDKTFIKSACDNLLQEIDYLNLSLSMNKEKKSTFLGWQFFSMNQTKEYEDFKKMIEACIRLLSNESKKSLITSTSLLYSDRSASMGFKREAI